MVHRNIYKNPFKGYQRRDVPQLHPGPCDRCPRPVWHEVVPQVLLWLGRPSYFSVATLMTNTRYYMTFRQHVLV